MDTEAKNYEITYLISPDVAEDQVFGEAGKVTTFIQDAHGIVGRIEEPRQRRLAYPIRKSRQAYYGWTTFVIAPERIAEVQKRLAAERNILRSLIVEEVKRPALTRRPRFLHPTGGPERTSRGPRVRLDDVKPFTPAAPKEEDKTKLEELDKKLEEILGK